MVARNKFLMLLVIAVLIFLPISLVKADDYPISNPEEVSLLIDTYIRTRNDVPSGTLFRGGVAGYEASIYLDGSQCYIPRDIVFDPGDGPSIEITDVSSCFFFYQWDEAGYYFATTSVVEWPGTSHEFRYSWTQMVHVYNYFRSTDPWEVTNHFEVWNVSDLTGVSSYAVSFAGAEDAKDYIRYKGNGGAWVNGEVGTLPYYSSTFTTFEFSFGPRYFEPSTTIEFEIQSEGDEFAFGGNFFQFLWMPGDIPLPPTPPEKKGGKAFISLQLCADIDGSISGLNEVGVRLNNLWDIPEFQTTGSGEVGCAIWPQEDSLIHTGNSYVEIHYWNPEYEDWFPLIPKAVWDGGWIPWRGGTIGFRTSDLHSGKTLRIKALWY